MTMSKPPFLPSYVSSNQDQDAKKQYLDKIGIIGGLDLYETVRNCSK